MPSVRRDNHLLLLRRLLFLPLLAAAFILAQNRNRGIDDLIVPGTRVGPVNRTSTENSLRQALGKMAVRKDIDVGEGMTEPGLMIYDDDPTRRLAIVWNDETPAHPDTIFICYGEVGTRCRWRTASGIRWGITLKDLESRNGKPFLMMGWGSDVGGNLVSFEGGKLEQELNVNGRLFLTLGPRTDNEGNYLPKLTDDEFLDVEGEKILPSNHPVLQKLNPVVGGLSLQFLRK